MMSKITLKELFRGPKGTTDEISAKPPKSIHVKPHVRYFNLPTATLIKLINDDDKWRPTNAVISICQYFCDNHKITDKQKWLLAFYLAYGPKPIPDASDEYVGSRGIKDFPEGDLPF